MTAYIPYYRCGKSTYVTPAIPDALGIEGPSFYEREYAFFNKEKAENWLTEHGYDLKDITWMVMTQVTAMDYCWMI